MQDLHILYWLRSFGVIQSDITIWRAIKDNGMLLSDNMCDYPRDITCNKGCVFPMSGSVIALYKLNNIAVV